VKKARLIAIAIALAALALAPAARAEIPFEVTEFDVGFAKQGGSADLQAGTHPYEMTVAIEFNSKETAEGGAEIEQAPKDILTSQVAGFAGAPTAIETCTTAQFLTKVEKTLGEAPEPDCPDSSAIGIVESRLTSETASGAIFSPAYNLAPPPGKAAKIGFWVSGVPVPIELGISGSPPYQVIGGPTNLSQAVEVVGAKLTLWGVPGDPAHDPLRGLCLKATGESNGSCPGGSPVPFLTLPRACEGPLPSGYEVDSWQHPGAKLPNGEPDLLDPNWLTGSALTHDSGADPRGMSGCGLIGFGPEVAAEPTVTSAQSASGIDFEIDVSDPNLTNPSYEAVAEADISAIETILPAGVTANPSAAEGLGVCTEAQFKAESLGSENCPEGSKLGSIEATTPLLEGHTLRGSVYLAEPERNPFGSLLALYIVIRDPERGVFIKLPAKVEPSEEQGPNAGRLITTVKGLPPFPLSHVDLHLKAGPRAPLLTPPACGTYTTTTYLTPSSGAARLRRDSSFTISSGPGGGPCPGALPFHPGFSAGTANNAAGSYSPFLMRITRQDGEQDLTRFSATLPPGVVGKIAGIAKCSDQQIEAARAPGRSAAAEIASPSCPAASRLGSVLAGAGVGSELTYVPGSLYLAGAYHGDPLSVVAIVPAQAGPFDVGVVVTRVGLTLNPDSARVQVDGAASDPIPHILRGIPLAVRELRISTDRPQFTLNATGCHREQSSAGFGGSGADPFSGADDTLATAIARYQAASCASLGFKPKLSLALRGGTKRARHPALHSMVTYPYPSGPGYSNIAKAVVTLPPSEFIDNAHINNPCTRVQFNAGSCPKSSVLGTARAITPLLEEPLEGPVYFRSNGGERALPDVVADLHGLVHIVLVGFVDTATPKSDPRIRTTFATVPDAPVTKFTLNLFGGKRGLLVNSADLCAHRRAAKVELTGQNGKRHDTATRVKTSCKKSGKGKKKH
jgi:hypothetical protein